MVFGFFGVILGWALVRALFPGGVLAFGIVVPFVPFSHFVYCGK